MTPPAKEQSQGLVCPNCSGVVPVPEGARVVKCPFCGLHSMVQGERGIYRWQVERRVERDTAEAAVRDFMGGVRKARDLSKTATITELILVYLPFWRVEATVAGWTFGRVRKDKDETRPDESFIFEPMRWSDAALDVTEFGVHRVTVERQDLKPFDSQRLHAEGMVFEPSESRTDAMKEAERHFTFRSRVAAGQSKTFSQEIVFLQPDFSLVYYPIWLARYDYRNRTYQVAIDGVSGDVMYGKAPGNNLFRAAALVTGLAAGNLVLVNGLILATAAADDDTIGVLLLPIIIGLALIVGGYRLFRYGEEVEDRPAEHRKQGEGEQNIFSAVMLTEDLPSLLKTGSTVLKQLSPADFQRLPAELVLPEGFTEPGKEGP